MNCQESSVDPIYPMKDGYKDPHVYKPDRVNYLPTMDAWLLPAD